MAKGYFGQQAWNKGLTKETDARVAQYGLTQRGRPKSKATCRAISETKKKALCKIAGWNKGIAIWGGKRTFSEAHCKALSIAKKGIQPACGAWNKGLTKATNKSIARMATNPKRLEALSKAAKARWNDPEWVSKLHKTMRTKPTKPELQLAQILEVNFPNEWKFVGTGDMVLGSCIPDFMNVNGKKQIIEVYGDYWHRNDNPQDRIAHFAQFGFSTLVIWVSELQDVESVVQRIKDLPSVETLHGSPYR